MPIQFKNAAKYYNDLKYQNDAWEFLQNSVDADTLEEFGLLYRNQKRPNYLAELPTGGVNLIKEFEGCHLNAYYDPLTGGLPITIGWGSTKNFAGQPFNIGDKISQVEADELLYKSLREEFLSQLIKIPYWNEMNENQRGALLSFSYNLGANFYNSNGFTTISRVLRRKEWNRVPEVFKLYRNPGTRVEAGLMRRRIAEGKLWNYLVST
jgi:lysozyme